MLLNPSINEIRKKVDSRYTLVVLAAKRARELVEGKPNLLVTTVKDVPVTAAAEEIAQDYITYKRDFDKKEAAL